MKWSELLELTVGEPVFSSSFLLAGDVSERALRVQLSRWVRAGRLIQLRRGLYALASPWRSVEPHPFLVANRLRPGTFVSLQSALAWHGVIPESVPVVTSLGPGSPDSMETPLGRYLFKHLAPVLRYGYARVEVGRGQFAFVASAGKALLDLVHLTPGGDSAEFIRELRLQDAGAMNVAEVEALARRSGKPKLLRAATRVREWYEHQEAETL